MENQINYFTNERIDKIIIENTNPTNSLSIIIPFSYALNLVDINWNDILFAITNGFFDKSVAIEYALILIGKGENNQKIMDLAILNPCEITTEEILQDYVFDFANTVTDKETTKDKIMYVLLNLLFDNKGCFEDPLRAVEIVYNNFGFPKILKNLIRYIPNDDSTEVSCESKIYEKWKQYLNNQKIRFSS